MIRDAHNALNLFKLIIVYLTINNMFIRNGKYPNVEFTTLNIIIISIIICTFWRRNIIMLLTKLIIQCIHNNYKTARIH